jgi:hypothetical protein
MKQALTARQRANKVLDRLREGQPASDALVTMALKITGDLERGERRKTLLVRDWDRAAATAEGCASVAHQQGPT